jgi:uncharacterized integral membrane protein
MKASTLVGWVIVSALTLFIFINWRYADINFLWIVNTRMPISLAMIIAAVMGFLAANFLKGQKKDRHD